MLLLIRLLICHLSIAYDVTSLIPPVETKYEQATKTAIQAAYKQSGYEDKVSKVKDASTAKGLKFIKDIGLSPVVAVGSAIGSVILNKKIEVHTGNFVFTGTMAKKEIDWMLRF